MKKVIFCTGKVYYDLKVAREKKGLDDKIALVRVEQICPFPYDLIKRECAKFQNAQLVWAQEEHKNSGCWSYVQLRFETTLAGSRNVIYVGRPTSPSPATGSKAQHLKEQKQLLEDAMSL